MTTALPIPGNPRATTALLIPGNMCDARMWRVEPSLAAMLAGRGLSVVDADTARDDTIAAMAARAVAAVAGPLVVVGFSMGAIVALEIARQVPERVRGLVLLDLNAAADLPERAAARPGQQAAVRAGDLERLVIEELKPRYFAQGHTDATWQDLRDTVLAMARALGPQVFVAQSEALRTRADLRPVLATLACPVLFGVGAQDALCPPEWHLLWQRLAPAARLVVFERAGHMSPLEAPVALVATAAAWLEEVGL